MLRPSNFVAAMILAMLGITASAQSTSPRSNTALDSILVCGDGFVFALKEPQSWRCI